MKKTIITISLLCAYIVAGARTTGANKARTASSSDKKAVVEATSPAARDTGLYLLDAPTKKLCKVYMLSGGKCYIERAERRIYLSEDINRKACSILGVTYTATKSSTNKR